MDVTFAPERFQIDLNGVRDDDLAVALLGFRYPQRVPRVDDPAIAVDEDANAYDATVEAVLPDGLVYLRVKWGTKRSLIPSIGPVNFGSAQFLPNAVAR
jgi:hypothetical protein